MERRNFLISLAALAPAMVVAQGLALPTAPIRGFKVAAGEGRRHGHVRLQGVNSNILDLKVSGQDTAGGMAIFEQISLSPRRGTPLHVHHRQNEVFYVVEGEYYFQVGNDKYRLKAGDSIFLPEKNPPCLDAGGGKRENDGHFSACRQNGGILRCPGRPQNRTNSR